MVWCEVLNAATMLPPPFLLLSHARNPRGFLAFAAIAAQVPFAMLYHLHAAFCIYYTQDADEYHRQLDQTAQHVAQLALTYSITGSWPYTLAAAVFHAVALKQLWSEATRNDGKRWRMIAVGVGIYVLPMITQSALLFGYATAPMVAGAVVGFVPCCKFRGSHAVMHVLAWMHADAVGWFVFLKQESV